MLGSSAMAKFELEFYEEERGDQPVLRWLREELTPTKRRGGSRRPTAGEMAA